MTTAIGSRIVATAVLLGLMAGAPAARADAPKDPKFEYAKPEEVKAVEWKAQAKVSGILTTGNSQTGTVGLGGSLSRKAGNNKFALDASWTYARSSVLIANDANGNAAIDPGELQRDTNTTANAWAAKARYDRFFFGSNSGFLSALVAGDTPSGKEFVGGGQIGYSRTLYHDARQDAVAEVGYDFSHESYTAAADSLEVHSLRLYVGYALKLTSASGLYANFEMLSNLNTEHVPTTETKGIGGEAGAFRDTRLTGKAGITATVWKRLSVSVGTTLRFDNVPAPRPAFKIPYSSTYVPLADKLDTMTEATLIYSFL